MRHNYPLIVAMFLAVAPSCGCANQNTSAPTTGRSAWSEPAPAVAPFPAPGPAYVTDLTDMLSPAQEQKLNRWIVEAETASGVQLRVLIIDSIAEYPNAPNQSIESFATGLFNNWRIGRMPQNDGVLLLVALKDRKARIELGAGYGRARDGAAARIMDEVIVSKFRDGDYPGGIEAGVQALLLEFAGIRVSNDG